MIHISAPIKLFIALLLGAVIGLERESREQQEDHAKGHDYGSLGVRTLSLITALGAVSGLLYQSHLIIFLLISITFMALLISYYTISSILSRDSGITTEIAVIYCFLIGVFVSLDILPIQLVIAIVIVLTSILSIKKKLHILVKGIHENELKTFLSYAIITLVIFPFLPNTSYTLSQIPNLERILSTYGMSLGKLGSVELFNPFGLWRVVVLFTGIEIAGYILEKTIGQKKGWLFTSIAGGFISSTSTTISLAQQSRLSQKNTDKLVSAAIFSNMSSFMQIFILIAAFNSVFLAQSTMFIIIITLVSGLFGFYFLQKKSAENPEDLKETQKKLQEAPIFSLVPALKFAVLFMTVRAFTQLGLAVFGSEGFLLSASLSAIAGLDAIVINTSEIAGTAISFQTAIFTLILINAVNLIAKTIYSFFQGKEEFALKFGISMMIVIIASFASLLFV